MQIDLGTLVVIVALAAASPLIVDVVPRIVLPVVVVEILVGIIVGPPILNLIHVTGLAQVLAISGWRSCSSWPASSSTSTSCAGCRHGWR